jgi:hypothetical protein
MPGDPWGKRNLEFKYSLGSINSGTLFCKKEGKDHMTILFMKEVGSRGRKGKSELVSI